MFFLFSGKKIYTIKQHTLQPDLLRTDLKSSSKSAALYLLWTYTQGIEVEKNLN